MAFKIPKIIRDMPLSDYAPEMGDLKLQVWVNPPREMIRQFGLIVSTEASSGLFVGAGKAGAEKAGAGTVPVAAINVDDQVSSWYSILLSQGVEECRMSEDDLKQLFDDDPALWLFISARVWGMIDEHRSALEKKPGKP